MGKPSKKEVVSKLRQLLKEQRPEVSKELNARQQELLAELKELTEDEGGTSLTVVASVLRAAPLVVRQLSLLDELNALTKKNPAFRWIVLDELDKQANSGRPRTSPSSDAYARAATKDAMRDLARDYERGSPRSRKRPSIGAAIKLAATRLQRNEGVIRNAWYAQSKHERDCAVQVFLRNPSISRKKGPQT